MNLERINSVIDAIQTADSVVAMTGAGVSTASGIPDFRSEDGIWNEYDPNDFHITRFRSDPGGFWLERAELVEEMFRGDIGPNAAHEALATLESVGHLDTLITQNIDGLHQQAGNETPIEIHGNGRRVVCTGCERRFDVDPVMDRVRGGSAPPTCEHCGDVLKPDVILFGERLPQGDLFRARAAARSADVFLAIGSSLTVEPAASLPRHALENGGTLCIVNLDRTDLSEDADYDFRADVTELLPRIADSLSDRC